MKKTNDYHQFHVENLKNPQTAADYLNAVLDEEDREMFLIALRNVAEACGGMAKVARHGKLNRSNLYKMLSQSGHPEIQTIHRLLDVLGLRLAIAPKKAA